MTLGPSQNVAVGFYQILVCLSLLRRPMAADFLALCNRFAHRIGLRDCDLDRTVDLAKDFVVVEHISTCNLSRL